MTHMHDLIEILHHAVNNDTHFFKALKLGELDDFVLIKTRILQFTIMRHEIKDYMNILWHLQNLEICDAEYKYRSLKVSDLYLTYFPRHNNLSLNDDLDDLYFYIAGIFYLKKDFNLSLYYISGIKFGYYKSYNNDFFGLVYNILEKFQLSYYYHELVSAYKSFLYLDDRSMLLDILLNHTNKTDLNVKMREFETSIHQLDYTITLLIFQQTKKFYNKSLFYNLNNYIALNLYTGKLKKAIKSIKLLIVQTPELDIWYVVSLLKLLKNRDHDIDIQILLERYKQINQLTEVDGYLLEITDISYQKSQYGINYIFVISDLYLEKLELNNEIFEFLASKTDLHNELYLLLCYLIHIKKPFTHYLLDLHNKMLLSYSIDDLDNETLIEYCKETFERNTIYFDR